MYIDAESKSTDLAQRWNGIQQHLTDEEKALSIKNLCVIEGRKLLAQGHELADDNLIRQLLHQHLTAQVVLFDPLRIFYTGDENSSSEVASALACFRQLVGGRALIVVHHVRKRPGARRDQFHLRDDPQAWSDGVRGSAALKAHADGVVMQELYDNERAGEVLDFAAILRSFPNIPPMALMPSEKSFAWHERHSAQDAEAVVASLRETERQLLDAVRRYLKQSSHSRARLVDRLTADGVRKRAMAYRGVARLLQLGLLIEEPTGQVSVLI